MEALIKGGGGQKAKDWRLVCAEHEMQNMQMEEVLT